MAFKVKLFAVLLLSSVLLICETLALVEKQDPELQRCKQQCEVQQQYKPDKKECKRACEESIRQKRERERQQGGRGGGRGFWAAVEEQERQEEEEEEEQQQQQENPYVFQDEDFTTRMKTDQGRVDVLRKFTEKSKLLKGIENYRLAVLEANPLSFVAPSHWDAEAVLLVVQGQATITTVHRNKRQSSNVKAGDIIRIPAGTPVYMINRDENEKLYILKLLQPVNIPGHYEAFYGPSGENPQSFYSAFSWEVLEAALNTDRAELKELLGQQKQGGIIKASKEHVKSLTHHEGGGIWPFAGESKGTFNLFNQHPSPANEYGRLYEADANDYPPLQDLDIRVSFANITKGSMSGPYYNSKSTKIAFVIDGEGHIEMACPHLSSWSGGGHQGDRGRQERQTTYQKVSAPLRQGTAFVVPASHPIATIASNNKNLEIICFEINAQDNHKYLLAGENNVIRKMERQALELGFNYPGKQAARIFGNQDQEMFFPGPSSRQQEGRQKEGGRADA